MASYSLKTPLEDDDVVKLKAGDIVTISGTIFTARDAAHKKLVDLISQGKNLPVDMKGQVIYYAGPAPAKPGYVIGSVGPTTSGRMDSLTVPLLQEGLKGMIGKGSRSDEVKEGLCRYGAVYFAAIGGAAALLSKKVKASKVAAYPELGPEAIYELEVEDFPVYVINDTHGNDLYSQALNKLSNERE